MNRTRPMMTMPDCYSHVYLTMSKVKLVHAFADKPGLLAMAFMNRYRRGLPAP